ncbi:MAG: tetratricopeptide repeat protein, partial [Pseudomonadota bacterium]
AALNRLVDYCPDYAEGYNQRAFAAFLQADYDAALADLDLALDRSPTHLGALSGKALTLMGMGRNDIAQDVLREALALNPWLPERRFLIERPGEKL